MHKFLVKNKIESYLSLDNIKAAFFVVMLKNYKKKTKTNAFLFIQMDNVAWGLSRPQINCPWLRLTYHRENQMARNCADKHLDNHSNPFILTLSIKCQVLLDLVQDLELEINVSTLAPLLMNRTTFFLSHQILLLFIPTKILWRQRGNWGWCKSSPTKTDLIITPYVKIFVLMRKATYWKLEMNSFTDMFADNPNSCNLIDFLIYQDLINQFTQMIRNV